MNISLENQVAIVTGASRGIGKEIAKTLAGAGAAVALAARGAEALEEVAEEIRASGGRALAVPTDVTDVEAVAALVSGATAELGKIDILVNNAATSYVANVVMSNDTKWRECLEMNVMSLYYCSKAVLKPMIRAKYGRIVNIASLSALVGAAHNSSYAASKAAMLGFTRSVAKEVGGLGITVNAICPWHVDTDLARHTMGARGKMFGKTAEEYIEMLTKESPQGRFVSSQEVAGLALFLCTNEARGITGTSLNLSGGAYIT
jgi:3-oxoacyl-[acyl-carrier protein] reductase